MTSVTTLSDLPSEVLALVLEGSSSVAILSLWKCGDARLNWKLSQGGCLRVSLGDFNVASTSRLPSMLTRLSHLKELRIDRAGYVLPPRMLASAIRALAGTLEILHLHFDGALSCLLAPHLDPSPTQHHDQLNDYRVSGSRMWSIGKNFPRLSSLTVIGFNISELCHHYSQQVAQHQLHPKQQQGEEQESPNGKKRRRLDAEADFGDFRDFFFKSPHFEHHESSSPLAKNNKHQDDYLDDDEDGIDEKDEKQNNEENKYQIHKNEDKKYQRNHNTEEKKYQTESIQQTDSLSFTPFSVSDLCVLPPSLSSLSIDLIDFNAGDLSKLPCAESLTSLSVVRLKNVSRWPPRLTHLSQRLPDIVPFTWSDKTLSLLPRRMKHGEVRVGMFAPSTAAALPPALQELSLRCVTTAEFARLGLEPWTQTLPVGLTRLECAGWTIFTPPLIALLPRTLTSLDALDLDWTALYTHLHPHRPSMRLDIKDFNSPFDFQPDSALHLALWPPSLIHLSFLSQFGFTDSVGAPQLACLPKGLKSIRGLALTAPLRSFPHQRYPLAAFFPHLELLSVSSPSNDTILHQIHLPSSLSSLEILHGFNWMSSHTANENWQYEPERYRTKAGKDDEISTRLSDRMSLFPEQLTSLTVHLHSHEELENIIRQGGFPRGLKELELHFPPSKSVSTSDNTAIPVSSFFTKTCAKSSLQVPPKASSGTKPLFSEKSDHWLPPMLKSLKIVNHPVDPAIAFHFPETIESVTLTNVTFWSETFLLRLSTHCPRLRSLGPLPTVLADLPERFLEIWPLHTLDKHLWRESHAASIWQPLIASISSRNMQYPDLRVSHQDNTSHRDGKSSTGTH